MSEAIESQISTDNQQSTEDAIGAQFEAVLATLSAFRGQITQIQGLIRALEKTVKKDMKGLKRDAQKGRTKGNRKRSGFAQPTRISAELCEFMEKADGTEIARTEVTQYVIDYIKDHKLQNPVNRKTIIPDGPLRKLLGVAEHDEVTYFNLQKYMNKHFPSGKQKENENENALMT